MVRTYERLADEEIQDAMVDVPEWQLDDNEIEREIEFGDFDQAMEFVNQVAEIARELDHHPEICIHYNKVELEVSTHKVGGLTEKDFELAKEIDKIIFADE